MRHFLEDPPSPSTPFSGVSAPGEAMRPIHGRTQRDQSSAQVLLETVPCNGINYNIENAVPKRTITV